MGRTDLLQRYRSGFCSMAAHAGVSRLMYVMGRDGVFPSRFFGYVHPKWRTPAWNVLLVGAIALMAIKFDW